jgi:hypothetical protein
MQIRGQPYVVCLYQCPFGINDSRGNKIYSVARARTVSDGTLRLLIGQSESLFQTSYYICR